MPVNILPIGYASQSHGQSSYSSDDLPKVVVMTLNPGSAVKSMDFHPLQQILLLVGTSAGEIMIWELGSKERLSHRSFKVWDLAQCSVALQKQIRIWDNVNEIIKGTVVVLIVKVTKDGYHAIGLVLSASEKWGVVNSGGECIWSLHPMCNRLSGDIYFSSCDFGAVPISNMEDKHGYRSI
nr:topless-related protein 4-like isoform X1 [Ipomoea batatas]